MVAFSDFKISKLPGFLIMPISKSVLEFPKLNEGEILPHGKCTECRSILNIGLFFDGTDNNRYKDKGKFSDSNVARLSEAYKDDPKAGCFRYYMQGVGTIFPEIGEDTITSQGGPWGRGGEARIVYALIQILNSIYYYVTNGRRMFLYDEIKLLTSEGPVSRDDIEKVECCVNSRLSALFGGNFSPRLVGIKDPREKLLMNSGLSLRRILEKKKTTPNISGIYIDVFGFSRGAAEARVFCTWLHKLMLSGGRLCGVPSYVRILGIFDTVASVGLCKSGHYSWATAQNLRIHREIRNCVHYIALHEFRNCFPLDSVYIDDFCPSNCFELICPGAHSDVGGGYEPAEQGKALEMNLSPINIPFDKRFNSDLSCGDKYKLSQFVLNQMLNVARKTCENHGTEGNPWVSFENSEKEVLRRQFDCAPQVSQAVSFYFQKCGILMDLSSELAMNEHLALYLAWRYSLISGKINDGFNNLLSVRHARIVDSERYKYYKAGNDCFCEQISILKKINSMFGHYSSRNDRYVELDYHSKANEIYKKIIKLSVADGVGAFYDQYVHDSFAGFIGKFGDKLIDGLAHHVAEPKCYITHRGMYEGNDKNVTAQNDQSHPSTASA